MRIIVSKADIDSGNTSLDACPITTALRRQFSNEHITVSRSFIRVPKKSLPKSGSKWHLIPLPKAAKIYFLYCNAYSGFQDGYDFNLSDKFLKKLKG